MFRLAHIGAIAGTSAAITIAAHQLGGGSPPGFSALVVLVVIGLTGGLLTGNVRNHQAYSRTALVLLASQLCGHLALTFIDHCAAHSDTAMACAADFSPTMLGTHCVAAGAMSMLIVLAGRMISAVSTAIATIVVRCTGFGRFEYLRPPAVPEQNRTRQTHRFFLTVRLLRGPPLRVACN